MAIRTIRDFDISGKRVLMRVDFNCPISEPDVEEKRHVEDATRIQEALPSVKYALEKGARLILMSHLGRPGGKKVSKYSLEPVADKLSELLKVEVLLADDCIGEGIEMMTQQQKGGSILLLENLRFHEEEEKNDPDFANALARLGDIYINDAFGTAHRKHASTYGAAQVMSQHGIGFLIEKELKYLEPLITRPDRPFHLILGGAKVTDKVKTVLNLLRTVNAVYIGGAMGHAFYAAEGRNVPADWKQPAPQDVEAAKAVMKEARTREIPIYLPEDTVNGADIGPKTIELFVKKLGASKTVFWNGPLGWFEKEPYNRGTNAIAEFLSTQDQIIKIGGGGDTVSAIHQSGFAEKFQHLSTGGGAVLEYLEEGTLPGIDILREYNPRSSPALNNFDD